jgi:uncharacterized protein
VVAAGGVGAAIVGAQPIALLLAGALETSDPQALTWLASLHSTTGTLGGFGYAALFALLAARLAGRRIPAVDAVAAAGQRSMSCYLMQSVIWAVAFTPFLLNLSGTLTVAGTALLATATWAATVVIADLMRRADHRGPFEALVRRVTYGGNHLLQFQRAGGAVVSGSVWWVGDWCVLAMGRPTPLHLWGRWNR